MRLFELDWHDYFADGVKLHDDYRRLNKERERNPDGRWGTDRLHLHADGVQG